MLVEISFPDGRETAYMNIAYSPLILTEKQLSEEHSRPFKATFYGQQSSSDYFFDVDGFIVCSFEVVCGKFNLRDYVILSGLKGEEVSSKMYWAAKALAEERFIELWGSHDT